MDSPGFCAQYCTYTAMDNESKKIISMVNIDKRETQRNLVVMEKEGFIRTFDTLCEELKVTEFCTDAHVQISALFSEYCIFLCLWLLHKPKNQQRVTSEMSSEIYKFYFFHLSNRQGEIQRQRCPSHTRYLTWS